MPREPLAESTFSSHSWPRDGFGIGTEGVGTEVSNGKLVPPLVLPNVTCNSDPDASIASLTHFDSDTGIFDFSGLGNSSSFACLPYLASYTLVKTASVGGLDAIV